MLNKTGFIKFITFLFFTILLHVSYAGLTNDFGGKQVSYPDPAVSPNLSIAKGPNYLIEAVHRAFTVFDENGNQVYYKILKTFFSQQYSGNEYPSQCKVFYHSGLNKFFLLALVEKKYLVAFTDDPTGSWTKFASDVSDYPKDPDFGFNQDYLYITSDLHISSGSFFKVHIRVYKFSDILNGNYANFTDFDNLQNENGTFVKSIRIAHHLTQSANAYLMNNQPLGDSDFLTFWRIYEDAGQNLLIERISTLNIMLYQTPPDAPQKNSSRLIETGDCRLQNLAYQDGYLHTVFTEKGGSYSTVRYVRVDANSVSVIDDYRFPSAPLYLYYPAVYVDDLNNVLVSYNASSGTKFISIYYRLKYGSDFELEEYLLKESGDTISYVNSPVPWGKYNGICRDPSNPSSIVFAGLRMWDSVWIQSWIGSYSFVTPIVFSNQIINIGEAGGNLWLDGGQFNSPDTIPLVENMEHEIKTQECFLNWNYIGVDFKNLKWNDDNSEFKLKRQFTVEPDGDQTAQFKDLNKTITVKNYLISAQSEGGEIEFKDPWWVEDPATGNQPNRFEPYQSPFTPGSGNYENYYGIFMERNPNSTPIYYSVQVKETQPILFHCQSIDWYFQNWETIGATLTQPNNILNGYYQSPVVFENSDAVVKAVYKGHLVSNSDEATAYNNSRLIAPEPNTPVNDFLWHAVYEDNGQIYYTHYKNSTNEWIGEFLVSEPNQAYNNKSAGIACLAVNMQKTLVGIVWERELVGFNDYEIGCRIFDTQTNTWSAPFYYSGAWSNQNLQPVITSGTPDETNFYFYVLFVENPNLGPPFLNHLNILRCHLSNDEEDSDYFIEVADILYPQADAVLTNPSVIPKRRNLIFCWEQSNPNITYSSPNSSYIHCAKYNLYNNSSEYLWLSPNGMQGCADSNPSISMFESHNYAQIAWQHFDGETGWKFRHQKVLYYNPQPEGAVNQVSINGTNLIHPSIQVNGPSGELNAVVQGSGNTFKHLFYNQSWSVSEETYDGKNPGIAAGISNYTPANFAISTDVLQGLPYYINYEDIALESEEKGSLPEKTYREKIIDLSEIPRLHLKGKVSLNLGNIRIRGVSGTQPWGFVPLSDSLIGKKFQQTVPLRVTADMQSLSLHYRIRVWDYQKPALSPSLPFLRLNLLNHAGNQLLGTLQQLNFSQITGSQFSVEDSLSVNLKPYLGKTIYLKLRSVLDILGNTGVKPVLIHDKEFCELPPGEKLALKKSQLPENIKQQLPTTYHLYQNYPNPFNPFTTISFDLPGESRVSLEIYDITGRKIRTLADGRYPVGSHRVVWDGRDSHGQAVASGVYAYRLRAGKHMTTRKLLLMK